MNSHPTAAELAEAVGLWIEQIRPGLDPRNAFLARVAGNAMQTLVRELTVGATAEATAVAKMSALLGHGGSFADLNLELCDRVRAGELTVETPGLLAALKVMALDQLAIDQPNYRHEGLA